MFLVSVVYAIGFLPYEILLSSLLYGPNLEFIYFVFRCYSLRCVVFFRSIFVLLRLLD